MPGEPEPLLMQASISFRPLGRSDYPLLQKWLAAPHVAAWWGDPLDLAAINEKYSPLVDGTQPTHVFVNECGTYLVGDPGKSAQVQVTGTYSQDGILSTGIGGTTVGTQYSQLKAGHAELGGKLAAPLLSGFTPTVGQKFTVVSASPVTGTFSNTTIPINSSEHFAISYTTTKVVLTVVSGPAAE
jgi:hypothetical protein